MSEKVTAQDIRNALRKTSIRAGDLCQKRDRILNHCLLQAAERKLRRFFSKTVDIYLLQM